MSEKQGFMRYWNRNGCRVYCRLSGFEVQREIANKIKPLHVKPDRITLDMEGRKVQGLLGRLCRPRRLQRRAKGRPIRPDRGQLSVK
jgi:hypothetical protein